MGVWLYLYLDLYIFGNIFIEIILGGFVLKAVIRALKWTTGIFHLLILPCYFFKGLIYLYGIPLFAIITLHIITILLAKKEGMKTYANYIGILTALFAFFPYIEIALHIIAAIFLLLDASSTNIKEVNDSHLG